MTQSKTFVIQCETIFKNSFWEVKINKEELFIAIFGWKKNNQVAVTFNFKKNIEDVFKLASDNRIPLYIRNKAYHSLVITR